MSTNYHTALGANDSINIAEVNSRLGTLDAGIATQAAASLTAQVALLYESQASTTNGGAASAATWQTRTLNTKVDADSIVALSSNQFTPIAGTYMIIASAPAYRVNEHRIRLYNVTQASSVFAGGNAYSNSTGSDVTTAHLYYIFTANGTDAYRIEHYTDSALTSIGLGVNVGDGDVEVYTQVLLMRLA